MSPNPVEILHQHFVDLPGPRQLRLDDHPLINIVLIAFCAVLCGAEHFTGMEAFGHAKKAFLSRYLEPCLSLPRSRGVWPLLRGTGPAPWRR